ncbi:MAG: TVP38/TMEM64 family protein [Desulfovibrionaceae bacterium]
MTIHPPHPPHLSRQQKASLRATLVKLGLLVLAMAVISVVLEHVGESHLSQVTAWVQAQGALAPIIFILVNALGVVLFIPQIIFTLVAGMLFGPFEGIVHATLGLSLGATACFLLARGVMRKPLERRMAHNPAYLKLEALSRNHPLKVLALSRTVPVFPIPLLSYLWGLTTIPFSSYLLVTMFCTIPETTFLTMGGHLLQTGVTGRAMSWPTIAALVGVALILLVIVTKARAALAREARAASPPAQPGDKAETPDQTS